MIVDNFGSHKGKAVRQATRSAGAKLFFLPKYSPDLNPIEQVFAKLKHQLHNAAARTLEAVASFETTPRRSAPTISATQDTSLKTSRSSGLVSGLLRDNSPRLSSDAKSNTPADFDIGKVVQNLKECCHATLFASVRGRKRPDRHFAGRGAVYGGHCPGALSSENNYLQGAAAERTPLGRVFAVKRSSNERPIYLFSCVIGWQRGGRPSRSPGG